MVRALLLILSLAVVGSCSMARVPGVTRAPAFFYRLEADFTLKETGEPVRFDYVVACGGVIMNNPHTEPTAFRTHHPRILHQPVGEHAVLGLSTINMCDSWKWASRMYPDTGAREYVRIPDNIRPLAIWFDDVNDLSFGWGYATDDAYTSPLAKIEFNGAKLTPTDEGAWRAWRKLAQEQYVQRGALPGPWGFNFGHDGIELTTEQQIRGAGYGLAGGGCEAQGRVAVPQDVIEQAFASAPEGTGRYWILYDQEPSVLEQILLRDPSSGSMKRSEIGEAVVSFRGREYLDLGTLSKSGGGHVRPAAGAGYEYHEVFPILPRSRAMPHDIREPQDTYYERLLTSGEYMGFVVCKASGRPLDSLWRPWPPHERAVGRDLPPFDPDAAEKEHLLYIDEVLVGDAPDWRDSGQSYTILDREGYLYFPDLL